LFVLIVLIIVVISCQLWPAGAPPFACVVNIVVLALSLWVFIAMAMAMGNR